MSSVDNRGRRVFLSCLGVASAGVLARGVLSASTLQDAAVLAPGASGEHRDSEYLFAPGVTYLNTAALGPTPRSVLTRTLEAWHRLESNPVAMAYRDGEVLVATDGVREKAAAFLGCSTDELLITRSTTDGMNALAQGMRLRPGDRILTTNHEHEGGLVGWQYLARRDGATLDIVDIPLGDFSPPSILERFSAAITPKTRVVSVSHVLTTNGLRMPITEIAALAKKSGIRCIVDGAQAVGHVAVNVRALGCDAYATSGHKWLMGPKGTGLLYVRSDAREDIAPLLGVGGNRFVSDSAGMGSLPLAIGLGAAIEAASARGMDSVEQRILALRSYLCRRLSQVERLRVMSPLDGPGATALVACQLPDGVDSGAFMPILREKHGVVVKRVDPRYFNGIRLSAHIFNTEADIDRALKVIIEELA